MNEVNEKRSGSSDPKPCSAADGPQLPSNAERSADDAICYRCKHRGLTLANIWCAAHEMSIWPSGVSECFRWQETAQVTDGG